MILIKMHKEQKKKAKKLIYLCSIYVNAIKSVCALPGLRQISELPHQL